jgi:hypothetical protein
MSKDRKRTPDEAWETIQRMALDDEAKRVESLSAEALDDELAKQGMDPKALRARGAALGAQLAKVAPASESHGVAGSFTRLPAKPRPSARARSIPWLAAAAAAAVVLAVVSKNRGPVVTRDAIGPDTIDTALQMPAAPSPQEVAAGLREEAYKACQEWRWALCERKLDGAKKLDPAGETGNERVAEARRAVSEGLGRDGGWDDKKRGPGGK